MAQLARCIVGRSPHLLPVGQPDAPENILLTHLPIQQQHAVVIDTGAAKAFAGRYLPQHLRSAFRPGTRQALGSSSDAVPIGPQKLRPVRGLSRYHSAKRNSQSSADAEYPVSTQHTFTPPYELNSLVTQLPAL